MKRILVMSMCLVMVAVFCACKPTPEKGVVSQKNSTRMLEDSKKTGAQSNKSLREQYGIPETYQSEKQGADGKLQIKADAKVIVPDKNAMPIYRVKATDFTQEQVDGIWETLISDTEMWEAPERMTKDEIKQSILNNKKMMAEEEYKDSAEQLQKEIDEMEKALDEAPDSIPEKRADGKLKQLHVYENEATTTGKVIANYTGFIAYQKTGTGDGYGKTINVTNNTDLKKAIVLSTDIDGDPSSIATVSRSAGIMYNDNTNPGSATNYNAASAILVETDTKLEADMQDKVGLSPAEAYQMVQEFLDKSGCGMQIDRVFIQDDEQDGNYDDIKRPAERYAYRVFCTRQTDGIAGAFLSGGSMSGSETGAESATGAWWSYESMLIELNKEGIFSMFWLAPLEVMETVNADAQLKPFSEIQEIFGKMIMIQNEARIDLDISDKITFKIDRVTLSLQRIAEQDSYENGLLVPVWNFYGKQTVVHGDGSGQYDEIDNTFLSINAIDGTVIDPQKGY